MKTRMTSAHAISLVALFIAIGGTAWAAATINSGDVINNSLKSKDLKDNKGVKGADVVDASLGTGDLADSSVNSAKLADGTVGTGDLAENAVTGPKIADNAVTGAETVDDSLTGADIDETTLGTVPVARNLASIRVKREDFNVADGTSGGTTATCPAGSQAIGGGVRSDAIDTDGYVEVSRPINAGADPADGDGFDGWRAFVFNQTDAQSGQTFGANTLQASVWAVCIG